jgi:hypothetical protein
MFHLRSKAGVVNRSEPPSLVMTSVMAIFRCAVKRRWSTAGKKDPPGNWIAPPGSNRSGGGGNKAAGASGVEGRIGDSASLQAVTRVNAEQASKTIMQEPTHPKFGEGRRRGISNERLGLSDLPG